MHEYAQLLNHLLTGHPFQMNFPFLFGTPQQRLKRLPRSNTDNGVKFAQKSSYDEGSVIENVNQK